MSLCVDTEGGEGEGGHRRRWHQCSSGGFRGDAQRGIRYKKKPKNLVTSSYWSYGLLDSPPAAVHSITVTPTAPSRGIFAIQWFEGSEETRFCAFFRLVTVTQIKTNNKSHFSLNLSTYINLVLYRVIYNFEFKIRSLKWFQRHYLSQPKLVLSIWKTNWLSASIELE